MRISNFDNLLARLYELVDANNVSQVTQVQDAPAFPQLTAYTWTTEGRVSCQVVFNSVDEDQRVFSYSYQVSDDALFQEALEPLKKSAYTPASLDSVLDALLTEVDTKSITDRSIQDAQPQFGTMFPEYLRIFNKLPIKVTYGAGDTFGVGRDDFGKQYFVYNPNFFVKLVLTEYLRNRQAYSARDIRGLAKMLMVYILAHEIKHIRGFQLADEQYMLWKKYRETKYSAEMENELSDIYNNLTLSKLLSSINGGKPLYPAGLLHLSTFFQGVTGKSLVGQTVEVFVTAFEDAFRTATGFKGTDITQSRANWGQYGTIIKKVGDSDDWTKVILEFPTSGVESIFGRNVLRFMDCYFQYLTTVMENPTQIEKAEWDDVPIQVGEFVWTDDGKIGMVTKITGDSYELVELPDMDPSLLDQLPNGTRKPRLVGGKLL